MENAQAHAQFPRGPYGDHKYVYAIIGDIGGLANNNNYASNDYSVPHKVVVFTMKIENPNVSDVVITTYDEIPPNSLDETYPPEGAILEDTDPIAVAIMEGVTTVREAI
jgi:hypothetical protein